MTIVCPVSGTANEIEEIEAHQGRCKQCGTDLRPLARINELLQSYCDEGRRLLAGGDVAGALERLTVAASAEPGSADIRVTLAQAYLQAGLDNAARAHLDRALELAPDRPDIVHARTHALRVQADREAAHREGEVRTRRRLKLMRLMLVPAFALGVVAFALAFSVTRSRADRPESIARVQQRLETHAATSALGLRVSEADGTLRVTGCVPSEVHVDLVRSLVASGSGRPVDISGLQICEPPPATAAPPPRPNYRVRSGDSLWRIAQRKYGRGGLWPEIEKANAARLGGSSGLAVGDSLVLPVITVQPR
ncbi:MAG: tetratricopeptide repeat protein [Candidatus Eisenbacteria bacterium]|uniref:Tetratricopeptide repeat protein n=1 Tax=Eiseniibacteriota bacterium TaxID=2212470 RepID=A0A937X776_UNCEI|nr:tetratricopeptide repeat protein [Candidatus Eisenbacteria bacterium]